MEYNLEHSDDEMDLLRPFHQPHNSTSTSRSVVDEEKIASETGEEEVLTSDPEELAEVLANRSLEKYGSRADSMSPEDADAESDGDLHDSSSHTKPDSLAMQPSFTRDSFRNRSISPLSSPTRMTQASDNNYASTEEHAMSEDLPPTSSPGGEASRYSPPAHLRPRLSELVEDADLPSETGDPISHRKNRTQDSDVGRDTAKDNQDTASHVDSAMSIVNSPRIDPAASQNEVAELLEAPLTRSTTAFPLDHPDPPQFYSMPTEERTSQQQSAWSPRNSILPGGSSARSPQNFHPSSPSLPSPLHAPHGSASPPPEPNVDAPHGRALRVRTARQQHPYAFEYANYKNTMRRAGLDDAIVKLQALEREKALRERGHALEVQPEMAGFIVPEDEESQDFYVPPATPPPRARVQTSGSAGPARPPIDMEALLAGFGGMISDDDSPARRRDRNGKGKEKETVDPVKKPAPKPFPINVTKRPQPYAIPSKSPSAEPSSSARAMRRVPPSSPAGSPIPRKHRRQASSLAHSNAMTPPKRSDRSDPSSSSSSSSSSSKPENHPESESDSSTSDSQTAAERKRLRILYKMMPAAWVRRQVAEEKRKREAKAANRPRHDRPLRPGQARAKTRMQGADRPLVLRGDSESDDDPPQLDQHNGLPSRHAHTPSPTKPFIRPRVFPPKRPTQISDDDSANDIIDLLSTDERSSVVEIPTPSVNDDEISNWLEYRSPKRATSGRGGGGDLINRMLSRTNGASHNPQHGSRKVRTGYDKDGHRLKQAKLTSMFRASSPGGVVDISSSDNEAQASGSNKPTGYKSKTVRKAGIRAARPSGAGSTRNPKVNRTLTIQGDLAELLDATILPSQEKHPLKSKPAHNRAVSTSIYVRGGRTSSQAQTSASSPTRSKKADNFGHRTASTDSGILPFRPHTKFSPSTYLGRGHLQNLLDVAAATKPVFIEATPVVAFGEHLDTRLTGTEFVDQIRRLIPHWTDWLAGRRNESDSNVARSFRFVALRVTHLLEFPNEEASEASLDVESESRAFLEEDATEIYKAVRTLSLTDPAMKDDSSASTSSWLSFHWFFVELAVRIACGNRRRALRIAETATLASGNMDNAIQWMIRSLLGHSLADNIREAYESGGDLDDPVLEIWVCLLYLVDETELVGVVGWKPLWSRVESVLDSPDYALPYKVYESERRWEYIFSFSALEAFSSQTGRLISARPPISRWPWVCKTIKDIRLKEDQVVEAAKQRRSRVDYYVRIVAARCWLMHTMWGWNYSQSDRLLNLLYPVFQTRKLSKLRDERTDFPTFIRNLDLDHLERFSNGDTAWGMFLKIFRRSIIDNPTNARKLYSAYAPVAVLNFTNENPATDMDLSRLFNSLAMFLVILITDPTLERGADCVKRIQGLMSFRTADMRSREACVRAFQYMGLLFKYYQLEMTTLTSWMHLMLQSLQDDMKKTTLQAQRNRLVVLALCLIRSVAAITSTSGFDHANQKTYPEVALLTEDFVRTIFQLDLKSNAAARREIKQFLEAFCHSRDAFLATLPPKPAPQVMVVQEESQESYGSDGFEIDFDNPETIAALDALEGDVPVPKNEDPLTAKERHTAEIFQKIVSPAVFDHIILGFGLDNRRLSSSPEQGYDVGEESAWIRVWFGCAKIVVENHRRSWLDYLNDWGGAKDEKISRIIDVSAERRVRIYFCYLSLKHTPALVQRGSKEQKHRFLLPWFQCLPHHRYTIEHKYTALICELGLTDDPLLKGLPCRKDDKGGYFVLSSELSAERGDYVRCIFKNMHGLSQGTDNSSSAVDLTRARVCIAKLFDTMRYTWELLGRSYAPSADRDLVPSYLEFCQGVRSSAAEFFTTPPIQDLLPRLSWVPLSS
ncbi:Mus7/mms22 family protein [Ceratobasidium sp. AG-Ba]|nr:Mus7/mms22 family protein [Ceratobasidium sp. AG-Ba]QRW02647.1 Mus7/mms22 family protein [Ceratobasidium sp. AG-Ba]